MNFSLSQAAELWFTLQLFYWENPIFSNLYLCLLVSYYVLISFGKCIWTRIVSTNVVDRRHINAFTFTTDRYKKSVTTKQNEQRTCWMCASCIHYHHQSFIQYSIPHSNSFLNIHSTSTDLHKSSKCVTAFRALPFMTMAITLSGHQPPLLAQETISECWNGEKICAHQRGKTANSFTLSDCQGLINEYSTVLSIR